MDDTKLAAVLRAVQPDEPDAPAFDAVWAAAEARHHARRRRKLWAAGAAAAVAVVAVTLVLSLRVPQEAPRYIEIADLLNSTSWSAPSDVLLPEYEFDLYEELPTLTPSTLPAEGALL